MLHFFASKTYARPFSSSQGLNQEGSKPEQAHQNVSNVRVDVTLILEGNSKLTV